MGEERGTPIRCSSRIRQRKSARRPSVSYPIVHRGRNGVESRKTESFRSNWRDMQEMTQVRKIVVVDYDPAWPAVFEKLRARTWSVVGDFALGIEHIGSTSVPGLAAKPIIDMCVVVPSAEQVSLSIERLATLGYVHRGDLGVEGREAFWSPQQLPAHHLYVCPKGNLGLMNPLALRD